MTALIEDLNISKIDLKTKTNTSSVKSSSPCSIDTILESVKDSTRGFIQWADLVEQLQLHFDMSRTQAAIEVRYLCNVSKLYLVPPHITASVVFSLEPITEPNVHWNEQDEKLYRKQNLDYVNELSRTVQNEQQQRQQRKRREELIRK
jgi:hypothetical protein